MKANKILHDDSLQYFCPHEDCGVELDGDELESYGEIICPGCKREVEYADD